METWAFWYYLMGQILISTLIHIAITGTTFSVAVRAITWIFILSLQLTRNNTSQVNQSLEDFIFMKISQEVARELGSNFW